MQYNIKQERKRRAGARGKKYSLRTKKEKKRQKKKSEAHKETTIEGHSRLFLSFAFVFPFVL